jgi:hypothetical protein
MRETDTKKIVATLLAEGLSLPEIQKKLSVEYSITMTFLDLRLMASELENVDWEALNPKEKKDGEQQAGTTDEPSEAGELSELQEEPACLESETKENSDNPARSSTSVEISKLARPGALASGSVRFGSGANADWMLDQLGRLTLSNSSGEPDETDIKEFQEELQKAIAGGM